MDKGVKGLLVGDLSPTLLIQIQKSIGKYEQNFQSVGSQIRELLDKQLTVDKFLTSHF